MKKQKSDEIPVVIVEDTPEIAEVLREVVQFCGATPYHAPDGEAGLQLIREKHPLLALLDIKMPKMNGYELCAAIQSDPALKRTRIMVLTGLVEDVGEDVEADWAKRMGVDDFVVKPFTADNLSARIKKLLETSPDSDAGN